MTPRRLLILGGTGEASVLTRAVLVRFGEAVDVTTALTGRTGRPGPIPGHVRIGGFAGAEGIAAYLTEHEIDTVIDATCPFTAKASRAARLACDALQVPRLILRRPALRRDPLDRWIEVDTTEAAAAMVGRVGRRALLTVDADAVAPFAIADAVRFVVRLADPPRERLPLKFHEVVLGGGPFSLAEERHLIARHAIDVLVCKASGGAATEPTLAAARELSLPVIMIRRPPQEPGLSVDTIEAALDWLDGGRQPELAQRLP
ncbi:MAG TPA: cobalt-precorrin-6A reductase [Stellaceae bacterium]|jgi:precorrin-6A/cobalt-precorrin-6A reductase